MYIEDVEELIVKVEKKKTENANQARKTDNIHLQSMYQGKDAAFGEVIQILKNKLMELAR